MTGAIVDVVYRNRCVRRVFMYHGAMQSTLQQNIPKTPNLLMTIMCCHLFQRLPHHLEIPTLQNGVSVIRNLQSTRATTADVTVTLTQLWFIGVLRGVNRFHRWKHSARDVHSWTGMVTKRGAEVYAGVEEGVRRENHNSVKIEDRRKICLTNITLLCE